MQTIAKIYFKGVSLIWQMEQIIKKKKEDMKMRKFWKYMYDSYLGKAKDIIEKKQLEEVTTEKLKP